MINQYVCIRNRAIECLESGYVRSEPACAENGANRRVRRPRQLVLLDDFTHFYRDLNSATFSKSSTITVTNIILIGLKNVRAYRRSRIESNFECGERRRRVHHSVLHPVRGCFVFDFEDNISAILAPFAQAPYLDTLPRAYRQQTVSQRKRALAQYDYATCSSNESAS